MTFLEINLGFIFLCWWLDPVPIGICLVRLVAGNSSGLCFGIACSWLYSRRPMCHVHVR